MKEIKKIANKHKLKIIEDVAEAIGAKVNKNYGNMGDVACFSFFANKIITTGEGGMLLIKNKKFTKKLNYLETTVRL